MHAVLTEGQGAERFVAYTRRGRVETNMISTAAGIFGPGA